MNNVQLNNIDHQCVRMVRRYSAEFGHSVNQLLLVPSEFEEAQRDYPILFRRDSEGTFQAVALLGLDRGENLFLAGDNWSGHYIPAFVRQGPFALGETEDHLGTDKPTILVDLDDPRISETEGEPLFLPQGGHAPPLEQIISALRTVHGGPAHAQAMFTLFLELELIQPVNIQIQLGDGLEYRIPDVFSIAAGQLTALSGERLEQLQRSGFLPHAIFARSSLANVNRLIELKAARLCNG